MAVRMVHTHHREAVGESRESLVGDASEAVVGSADKSRVEPGAGAPGGPAACPHFDGLFGLAVEAIVRQAASHGGEVGIREHAWSAHTRQEDTAPRG